jgi:hypothetical protein
MNFIKLQAKLQSKVDWVIFAEYFASVESRRLLLNTTSCLVNGNSTAWPDEIHMIDSASKQQSKRSALQYHQHKQR